MFVVTFFVDIFSFSVPMLPEGGGEETKREREKEGKIKGGERERRREREGKGEREGRKREGKEREGRGTKRVRMLVCGFGCCCYWLLLVVDWLLIGC